MKIDPSKKYTSGGHPVEFLHRAPEGWSGDYPWRGIVNGNEYTWTDEGVHLIGYPDHDSDLTEAIEPKTIWVNEYKGHGFYHNSKEDAERAGVGSNYIRTAVEYREVVK